MTTGQKKWMRVGIVLVACASVLWYSNPIRLPQKVQLAGVTVQVPFGWVMQTTPSQVESVAYVGLRRAHVPWLPTRPSVTAMISGFGKPYTMESARRAQAWSAALYSDSGHYSNPKTFDVTSGKYSSLCAEGTMPRMDKTPDTHVLTCYVVDTPLLASFMGPKDVDGDAERILKSLN